ncbi:hypothetical protein BC628DRAFT_1400468 [Trametes gibbosa]|nr:hypothetical protein BC628DRAFT_1400468 [Trametes gibbosa]
MPGAHSKVLPITRSHHALHTSESLPSCACVQGPARLFPRNTYTRGRLAALKWDNMITICVNRAQQDGNEQEESATTHLLYTRTLRRAPSVDRIRTLLHQQDPRRPQDLPRDRTRHNPHPVSGDASSRPSAPANRTQRTPARSRARPGTRPAPPPQQNAVGELRVVQQEPVAPAEESGTRYDVQCDVPSRRGGRPNPCLRVQRRA